MKHVYHRLITTAAAFLFLLLFVPLVSAATGDDLIDGGMEEFGEGKYRTALLTFRDIVLNSSMEEYHGTAYYWIARSYMAMDDLEKSEQNLEYFISQYDSHELHPDALYQKGRLLYLQEEYQKSIRSLYTYMEKYPSHPYRGNAYFWVGESFYSLGHYEKAESIFSMVVRDFQQSYKYEAAKYRLSLIDLKRREEELLKLLKLSHEEYLKAIEMYNRKEKSYEQALSSYRRKLAAATSDNDNELIEALNDDIEKKNEEIRSLNAKNEELKDTLRSLENRLEEADGQSVSAGAAPPQVDKSDRQRLLGLKNRALSLKEDLIRKLNTQEGGQ